MMKLMKVKMKMLPRPWADEPGCLRRMTRWLVEERSPGNARHVGDLGDGRRAKDYPQKILYFAASGESWLDLRPQ